MILSTCKKDKDIPERSTSDLLKGVWEVTAVRLEYYMENQKVHETQARNPREIIAFNEDNTFQKGYEGTYEISNEAGREYLILHYSGDSLLFEIKSISMYDLTLVTETSPDSYLDGNTQKDVSKSISTISLIRLE